MKKFYRVELFYNWHTGFEVKANTPEEAWEIVRKRPWSDLVKDFNTDDLDFDTYSVFDENGDCLL